MSQDPLFPIGEFGFLINPIDRAAHLRDDAEKLFALEGKPNSRAFVIHRDNLLMKQDGDEVRAALTIKEALGFGANPGTIFIGLKYGAPSRRPMKIVPGLAPKPIASLMVRAARTSSPSSFINIESRWIT